MKPATPSTRLYAILARRAPFAVVFRRGPSKQVLTLSWNTDSHEIRRGQWFKGRIYERRCDLSPSGEKLIYFAAKHREPLYTWTAVSRPPFLTALAMWPKGDAWGGGGLFENERLIRLNHRAGEMKVADDFHLARKTVIEPFGRRPGWGEDDPIMSARMTRDGWVLRQAGTSRENKYGSKVWFEFPENIVWTKARGGWTLEIRTTGIKERDGPWYIVEHRTLDASGETALSLGRSDWADWSRSGEVLLARDGRLFRIHVDAHRGPGEPIELVDLRGLRFEEVEPPSEALEWNGLSARGRVIS